MASLMFKGSGQNWTEKAININDHRRQKVSWNIVLTRAMEHCDDTVMEHCDEKNSGALS